MFATLAVSFVALGGAVLAGGLLSVPGARAKRAGATEICAYAVHA